MRRLKKLVTLFLAALMAISCMLMPAMAADDGIMPLGALIHCDSCGAEVEVRMTKSDPHEMSVPSCSITSIPHIHFVTVHRYAYTCRVCGYDKSGAYDTYVCYGGQ